MSLLRRLRPLQWLLPVLLLSACVSTAPEILYKDVTPPSSVSIQPLRNPDRPVVALVLGSGGIRGFAHIAVIKVLEAHHIPVDIVVGTSVGSVVGSLYAGGYTAADLERLAVQLEESQIRDYSITRRGIIGGERLQDFVNRALENRDIEQLPKPFAAVATELDSGRMAVFNHGNTGVAVRASSSIPSIFNPVEINHITYVDGDLKNPVPASIARQMGADVVIAVDISQQPQDHPNASGLIDVLVQSIRIMRQSILGHELKEANVVIRPGISVSSFDFSPELKQTLFKAGEEAATAALPQIFEQLQKSVLLKQARAN
jgi:NTE family protein